MSNAMIAGTLMTILVSAAPSAQRTFASPDSAMTALVDALKRNDTAALLEILGPEAGPLLLSGDPVADERARRRFLEAHAEGYSTRVIDQARVAVDVGRDRWPFPIPLVRQDRRWRFDAAAGTDEMLSRRIGENELNAIQVCAAYVDAQHEYAERIANVAGLPQYASKFFSDPGQRNGLYWETEPGEEPSPLGPLIAKAQAEGYKRDPGGQPVPYHGYFYRILTQQGPHAEDGAHEYLVDGKMIGGFGLIATPAKYGSSGVMTFIVNQDGVIYQRDLGPETAKRARRIVSFDPDPSWILVDEGDLIAAK